MERNKLVNPMVMWAIVALGVGLEVWLFPNRTVMSPSPMARYILVPAVMYWLILFIGAVRANRDVIRSAAAVHHVATGGVYALVRHPIY